MDLSQTFEDIEDVAEALEYSERDTLAEYDEDDIATIEEEEQEIETESEIIEETEILADYMTEFEARRMKEYATKAKEKREQLQQLIGVQAKQKDDTSEETLITLEEEITESDEISTESSVHPCLGEIDISDSQLKLANPYTVYAAPEDPGLLPAYWLLHEQPPIYEEDSMQFYNIAKRFSLRPIRLLRDMFITDEINLRYYGIESRTMGAMCEALKNNTSVREVDLKGNQLSIETCGYLKELLLKNNAITSLSLSGCQIGASGAKKLHDAIFTNTTLKIIDLSNCNIEDEGFEHIASALSINDQGLESINLSDNRLDELCSESLRNLLSRSDTLMHLDLSWNFLNSVKTWKALIDGLERNQTLLSLNLSWNGLGQECVPLLYQLLIGSQSIVKLDLSWNRFTENDAVLIAKGLSKNSTLQELYLGNNPLKAQGALVLVRVITQSPLTGLCLLNLENVWANKNILQELETIRNTKPWITVKLGGILSNYQLAGPNIRRILLKRANYEAMAPKRRRQKRNFGHFLMSLEDKMVSQAKFKELIQKFKLKLSISLINEIMKAFEGPTNTVDQGLLKSFYLEEYPETTAAPSPQKTIKKTNEMKRQENTVTNRNLKKMKNTKVDVEKLKR